MLRRHETVTWGRWCVSTCSPPMNAEKGASLSVFILRGSGRLDLPLSQGGSKFQYGEGHGKLFNSSDEAFAWALERGYLQRYYTAPELRKLRKERHARCNIGLSSLRRNADSYPHLQS